MKGKEKNSRGNPWLKQSESYSQEDLSSIQALMEIFTDFKCKINPDNTKTYYPNKCLFREVVWGIQYFQFFYYSYATTAYFIIQHFINYYSK